MFPSAALRGPGGPEGSLPDIPEVCRRITATTLGLLAKVGVAGGLGMWLVGGPGRWRSLTLGLLVAALSLGLRRLADRGHPRLAGWLLVGVFVSLFGAAAWTAGGLAAPAIHAFLLVVLLAGLMLGPKEGIQVAVLVALVSFLMALAQVRGLLPAPWVQHTPWSRWVGLAFYAGFIGVFQAIATRYIVEALARAEQEIAVRRRAEEALQAAHDALERRVEERTEALAQALAELGELAEALQSARASAEAANAAKSRFLALVSHELRSPLTSIKGSLGLLAGGRGDGPGLDVRELAALGGRNVDRMLDLINELLDLEKAEAGEFHVLLEPLDLREPLRQAQARMAGYAAQRGLVVALRLPETPCLGLGDGPRLEQVCLNLLSNALKHAEGQEPVLIDGRMSGPRFRVEVSNAGAPIPEDFRAALFEPFQQARSEWGSTGLGLSLSKAVVEAHGGRLDYAFAEGRVAFHFEVPLPEAAPAL